MNTTQHTGLNEEELQVLKDIYHNLLQYRQELRTPVVISTVRYEVASSLTVDIDRLGSVLSSRDAQSPPWNIPV